MVDDPVPGVDSGTSDHIRRVLARELHDRVAQTLTTMLIELENFKLEQTGRQGVLRKLDDLQESTRDVLANLREVLYELRGETGIEAGFAEAVRTLLGRFQARTRITAQLYVARSWPSNLRAPAALHIYRIIEEALANVRLHSGAGLVEVALGPARGTEIHIEVRDDGRGNDSGGVRPGMGLLGMQERAMIIGGRLEVLSVAGGGTTVRAIFPREQLI
ncbi:MAG TPA: sensor histidine kinase [Candidatus Dormibacteraeota bacterium]|nr:sensor histidine kinase [Candidatus Dormibacteraeota bacterium]